MKTRNHFQRALSLPWVLLIIAIAALLGAGLWLAQGEWLQPAQIHTDQILNEPLQSVAVGQTFVARQAGLQAIDVRLDWPSGGTGELTLHLLDAPGATEDIQSSTVSAAAVRDDGWVRFPLRTINSSRSHYYYLFIEPSSTFPAETVTLYAGLPDSYPDGALYLNHQPQEAQLAFRLVHDRPAIASELLGSAVTSIPAALIALLTFTLPGWALVVLFQRFSQRLLIGHWLEGASVAAGLSMAFYPILFLAFDLVGWQPGRLIVWLSLLASLLLLLWHYRPWRLRWRQLAGGIRTWAASDSAWADSALLLILLGAASGRLLMVRNLEMPLWHDSVQHAVITRRIMETGGLFQSWLPYSPHTTFSFHFGFHLDTAVFGWVTGLDTAQAMIWGGQLFNLLAVFTLYALAYRLKGVWAGVIAVLVAGLFTQFPLYYTNWGRYPQLMGQAILPVAAWWTWVTLQTSSRRQYKNPFWILAGATLIAGTILGYYPMAFHYLAFVVAALILYVQSKDDLLDWRKGLTLAATAVVTVVMMLPWIGKLLASLVTSTTTTAAVAAPPVSLWATIQGFPLTRLAPQMLMLLLGTLAILWWGRKAALPVLWFWMLIILPIVEVTPLPGSSIISDFTIHTSLYIPIALIWAIVGSYLLSYLSRRWQQPFILLLILVALLWQMPKLPRALMPQYDLSSRPDLQAMAWIRENLPEDAYFLINGFDYKDSPAAGDAGWWLPLLTGRQTNIPPQYATFVEQPVIEGFAQTSTQFVVDLLEESPVSPEGKATICDFPYPITHVYIGQKRGMIEGTAPDATPARPLLPAELLLADPDFDLLYRQDRVLIFAFNRAVCGNG